MRDFYDKQGASIKQGLSVCKMGPAGRGPRNDPIALETAIKSICFIDVFPALSSRAGLFISLFRVVKLSYSLFFLLPFPPFLSDRM